MGKQYSKGAQQATEIDNTDGLRIDLIHLPTAVSGSVMALVIIISVLIFLCCCCRRGFTKFCFKRVFKNAHHHILPVHQPDFNPTPGMAYAGQAMPVRHAPPPPAVRMEQPPIYEPPPAYHQLRPATAAIIYRPAASAPTVGLADRIQDVTDNGPAAHL